MLVILFSTYFLRFRLPFSDRISGPLLNGDLGGGKSDLVIAVIRAPEECMHLLTSQLDVSMKHAWEKNAVCSNELLVSEIVYFPNSPQLPCNILLGRFVSTLIFYGIWRRALLVLSSESRCQKSLGRMPKFDKAFGFPIFGGRNVPWFMTLSKVLEKSQVSKQDLKDFKN